jgi:serine/threonine protein kinase
MSNVSIIKPFKVFGKRAWPNKIKIASTGASNVYKVGEGNVLKVSKKNADAVRCLIREAEFLQRAGQHNNIVAMHEQGAFLEQGEGGNEVQRFYMVVEYLAGGSLDEIIGKQKIEPSVALKIARNIAQALGRVHELGKVYRDIKPHNIIFLQRLPAFGKAVLVDFGLVEDIDYVQPGRPVGSPGYFPPEVILGNVATTPVSDLYSLAIVLYEMLVKEQLYQAENREGILQENLWLHGNLPGRIRQGSFAPRIKELLLTALYYDRDAQDFGISQRYQTADEFIGAIDRALDF